MRVTNPAQWRRNFERLVKGEPEVFVPPPGRREVDPADREDLSARLLARIDRQRQEARRRCRIVITYRRLLAAAGRHRRTICRWRAVEPELRRLMGVGVRSAQRYAAWLRRLTPVKKRLLFCCKVLGFYDLPARIFRTARRRFEILRDWSKAVRIARPHRVGKKQATALFVAGNAGLSSGSLYRWRRAYWLGGPGALLDVRFLWLL